MANIKVNIDVDSGDVQIASDKVLTLQQQIKALRQELQKTPEGTKEFGLLVNKLNDTQDAFSRVNIKGKEIFGTLGLIPGPIGEIAARTNSAIDALKIFGSFNSNDIKAQFTALKDDFIGAGKALANLTGITSVYTATLNRFTGAAGVASTATKVLAASVATLYAALGVGVIMAVVYAFSKLESSEETVKKKIDETTASLKKQNEEFEYNKKLSELNSRALIDQMKLQGFSEKEIREKLLRDAQVAKLEADVELRKANIKFNENEIEAIRLQGVSEYSVSEMNIARKKEQAKQNKVILKKELKDRTLIAQEANNNLLDLQVKYYEEDKQKREDASKKAKDQRDKDLAEINKNTKDATNSLMTEREQARQKITEDYVIKIALAKQYGKDTYVLEEAQRKAQKELADKYAAEDKDAADKIIEERIRTNQAAFEYQRTQFEELADLDKQRADNVLLQNSIITQSYINLGTNIATVLGSLANTFSANETLQKIFAVTQVAVNTASSIGTILLNGKQQQAEYNTAIAAGNKLLVIGAANAIAGNIVLGGRQIAGGTAAVSAATAGKAKAKISTIIQASAAGVVGAAQIAAILSAKKSSSSSSGGGGGADSGGGGSAPAFSAPAIGAPQIGASLSQSGTISGIVGQTIGQNNSKDRPIRAYVVGNEITTEQQLQRRIKTAARLGG